jgi:hypothetical protein
MTDTNNSEEFSLSFMFDDEESRDEVIEVATRMDLDYDAVDGAEEEGDIGLAVYGTKEELVALAAEEHRLHGHGFSFNEEEVIEAIEEL